MSEKRRGSRKFLDKDEKEYDAAMRLGFETDTGDATGTRKVEPDAPAPIEPKDIEAVLPQFTGELMQTPPMYSAKKIAGKKLYEHARRGETIERKPVPIAISKLEMVSADGERAALRVACSAGTYVRILPRTSHAPREVERT